MANSAYFLKSLKGHVAESNKVSRSCYLKNKYFQPWMLLGSTAWIANEIGWAMDSSDDDDPKKSKKEVRVPSHHIITLDVSEIWVDEKGE